MNNTINNNINNTINNKIENNIDNIEQKNAKIICLFPGSCIK